MSFESRSAWLRLSGAAAIALLVIASLTSMMAQPRTILGWQLEHFLGYFVATLIVCAAWPRPLTIAVLLVLLAGVLEILQYFTPDRHPNFMAVVWSAGGTVLASALAELLIRARKRRQLEPRKIP